MFKFFIFIFLFSLNSFAFELSREGCAKISGIVMNDSCEYTSRDGRIQRFGIKQEQPVLILDNATVLKNFWTNWFKNNQSKYSQSEHDNFYEYYTESKDTTNFLKYVVRFDSIKRVDHIKSLLYFPLILNIGVNERFELLDFGLNYNVGRNIYIGTDMGFGAHRVDSTYMLTEYKRFGTDNRCREISTARYADEEKCDEQIESNNIVDYKFGIQISHYDSLFNYGIGFDFVNSVPYIFGEYWWNHVVVRAGIDFPKFSIGFGIKV